MFFAKPARSFFFSAAIALSIAALPAENTNPAGQRVRQLNNDLLRIHGYMQQIAPDQWEALREEAAPVLEQRFAALSEMIQRDPSEALKYAFSPELADDLAAKIQSPEPPARATASHRNQTASIDSRFSTLATTSTTTPTCSTTGVQDTAVLFGYFPGQSIPSNLTVQNIHQAFFGTTGRSLDGYWQEASYGQTSATGQVYGPYALSTNYGCTGTSDFTAMLSEFLTDATNAGANFSNVTRLFLVTPDFGCGWAGAAYVPSPPTNCPAVSTPTGTIHATTSYVNGTTWQYNTDNAVGIAAHEGGHNLGLSHSNSRAFSSPTEALGALATQGTDTEYGDGFSAMTNGGLGHYGAPHKVELLGWIGSPNYEVIETSGTYTIEPFETALDTGLKALKVQRGTGNNDWLWIEYRQPVGNYDNSLANSTSGWGNQVFSGALIHYEDSLTSTLHTDLLDLTATSAYGFLDPSLAAGQTWVDPYTNVSISVLSTTSTGLTVSVNYGVAPCTPVNPTVTASPLDPSIYPGNSTGYNVSITNNDSTGCSASTFNLGSTLPSAWPTTFSASAVTLNPGQSGSVTMTKTGPSGTPPGTYAVNASAANAANSSYAGSGTANLTVMSAPTATTTVTVSVPSTSYTRRSTVSITATVMSGSTPVSGASVTFTMTLPNGSTVTQSATTNRKGTATWSYKLNSNSPTGKYSVSAQAALSSTGAASTVQVTSNIVSFTVQ
jgi:M6 family metalloprotease-like protein